MIYIVFSDMTEEQREAFVRGWEAAGGYMGDIDSPTPWCAPWLWCEDFGRLHGSTPEEWGAEWWREWQGQIKAELRFEFQDEETQTLKSVSLEQIGKEATPRVGEMPTEGVTTLGKFQGFSL